MVVVVVGDVCARAWRASGGVFVDVLVSPFVPITLCHFFATLLSAIEGVRETHFFFIPPQPQFESGGWLSDNNASFADFGLSDRVTVEFKVFFFFFSFPQTAM